VPAASSKAPPLPPPRPALPKPPPLPPNATPSLPTGPLAGTAPPLPPRPRVPAPQELPSPPTTWTTPESWLPGATRTARRRFGRPLAAGAGIAVLALGVAALGLWLRGRPSPAPAPSPSAASAVSELTQELVRKQVQLARRELDNKDYAAAAAEAEGALKLAPGHAEAGAVLARTRERLGEIDQSIGQARRLLDAGDTAGASSELSHLLELDPSHPAAAELSARLNSAFRARADEAATSMRAARAAALAAGVTAWSLRSVDAGVSQAELLLSRSEFADATRMFLEARDAFDRSRRAALQREPATAAPDDQPAAAPAAAAVAAPPPAARPASTSNSPIASPPGSVPAAIPQAVPRGFNAGTTSVAAPSDGGPEGFDGSVSKGQRPPQFAGRLEFEVLPPAVRPGEPFVVRIHLRNDGRRAVKIRGVSLAAVVDGRRVAAPVTALQREVGPNWRALVAEYSGVWSDAASWSLEVVVTADRDERITSRLQAN